MEEILYKHSGQSSKFNFLIALALGIILAIGLGFIYNFLIAIMPIVYINFLITYGFGSTLGYSTKFLSRLSKIRNNNDSMTIAGIIGFVGFYFQWIAYFVFLDSGEYSFALYQNNFDIVFKPALFLDLVLQINKVGIWSIFGVTFKDFPLWIIWGLEAALIIGIPILIVLKHPIIPFSETLNKWYPKFTLKYQFERISAVTLFKEMLMENVEQAISSLKYGDPYRYSEISIYYLEREQKQYLSIDNVLIEGRGRGKSEKTSVVHLMPIDKVTAENLMQKFGSKKELVLNY